MNCKSNEWDFVAYLNSYLGFSVKIFDLIISISQVPELSKDKFRGNERECCRDAAAVTIPFSKVDVVNCLPSYIDLKLSTLNRLRVAFRKKKSGLTKYLLIVFITLYFI